MATIAIGDCTVYDSTLSAGIKEIILVTPNTADDGDDITINLNDHGIKKLLTINGFAHSTEDSIVVTEAPTTSVTSGALTILVGGSTDNLKRAYIIRGSC